MNSVPESFNNKILRHVWDYRDAQGEVIGHVARFDGDGQKEVVPYFNCINGHGWDAGSATEPHPLFGLDVLAQADPSRAVFIVEGEKAAAALRSMGLVAITSQGGSKAVANTDWKPLEGRKHVLILPDHDAAGKSYAKAVTAVLAGLSNPPDMKIVHLPDLPDAGDAVDWIHKQIEKVLLDWNEFTPVPDTGIDMKWLNAEFRKVVKSHSTPVPDDWLLTHETGISWQAPVSLTTTSLPPWPDDVFPDSVQEFVSSLAESTETPLELSALLVLASIAAAAQGKYQVRLKQDYFEPVNIWTCAALPPASRKTAVQNAATTPLTAWEKVQRETMEPEIKKAHADHATITEQISYLRKVARKAKGADFDQLKKEIADIEADLPEIPTVPQVWAQDVTTEHLGTIMGRNNERMAVMSDEAGIFDILAGRYSGGVPNLDLFLQGHAGSPVKVDRGSRPSIFMQSPSLTLGLSPQPEVLRGLTDNKFFRGRGLLGRFLYALPPSNLGYRTFNTRTLSDDCKLRYEGILTALLNHEMAGNAEDEKVAHILKLSCDAQKEFQGFAHKIEARMREGGIYSHITDWAGKFVGAMARVAALLHITRHAFGKPSEHEINLQDMEAALRMADVLSAHALAVFDLMGADPALDGARHVLRWIKQEGVLEFTFRDCHYAHKTKYKRTSELDPVIEVLIERHYIRAKVIKVAHRPSRLFEVNPGIIGKQA